MWNLRWQVAGYLQVLPNSTDSQLHSRFTEGADIHGANIKRACIEHSWEQQQQLFARFLLTNAIAIYEGWLEEMLKDLNANTTCIRKGLQYPQQEGVGGVRTALNAITANESRILKDSFYAVLCAGRHYAGTRLDALILCYRFFKELRNCMMHNGCIADQRLFDAYTAFSPAATCSALGVKQVPVHDRVVIGSPVQASLRGVVGFSNIVIKLMATFDAEFSRSQKAENSFLKRWQRIHSRQTLPQETTRRNSRVRRMTVAAGYGVPEHPEDLAVWLKDRGLVVF